MLFRIKSNFFKYFLLLKPWRNPVVPNDCWEQVPCGSIQNHNMLSAHHPSLIASSCPVAHFRTRLSCSRWTRSVAWVSLCLHWRVGCVRYSEQPQNRKCTFQRHMMSLAVQCKHGCMFHMLNSTSAPSKPAKILCITPFFQHHGCLTNRVVFVSSRGAGQHHTDREPSTGASSDSSSPEPAVAQRWVCTEAPTSPVKCSGAASAVASAHPAPPAWVPLGLLLVQAAQNAVAFRKCEANPGLLTFRNFCSVPFCDGMGVGV